MTKYICVFCKKKYEEYADCEPRVCEECLIATDPRKKEIDEAIKKRIHSRRYTGKYKGRGKYREKEPI